MCQIEGDTFRMICCLKLKIKVTSGGCRMYRKGTVICERKMSIGRSGIGEEPVVAYFK